MKSGTTTLHRLLARHPDIFMPDRELHFFCFDDFAEHPDYVGPVAGKWKHLDFDRDPEANVSWYCRFFEGAQPHQVVGERSTVYLASTRAPKRIADLLPDVKLIFLLRDPVQRTYSHYWHRVRSGEVVASFEHTLRHAPHSLLTRSYYQRQLEAYLRHFPRERIKILLLEELMLDIQRSLDEVARFLDLRTSVDAAGVSVRRHRGAAPRFPRLLLWQNRLLRHARALDQQPDLPGISRRRAGPFQRLGSGLDRALRRIQGGTGTYPAMRPKTRAFLEQYFVRENAGLSELLGVDLHQYWPYF